MNFGVDDQLRIVSLLASGTEILCALGLHDSLVGRSHECDYPETIRVLPQLTAPKFVPDGRSYQIDQRIRAIVAEGLSIYRVDVDLLRSLRPGIIVTQVQCDVCAVSLADVEEALAEIAGYRPRVVALNPNSLADIEADMMRIAGAAGVEERGHQLIAEFQRRLAETAARRKRAHRPTVATVEWLEPLMSGGNWMPELVELAGGTNLFGEAGKHSPWMEPAQLLQSDPDILLLLPCGFDIERTEQELAELRHEQPFWNQLRAVREGRAFILDGNQYFNRSGPRIADSLEILAEIFDCVASAADAPLANGEAQDATVHDRRKGDAADPANGPALCRAPGETRLRSARPEQGIGWRKLRSGSSEHVPR